MESDIFKQLQEKHEFWLKGYRSLTRYIANRDHSEKELQIKLSQKYEPELVSDLIQFAHDSGWMPKPEDMARRTAQRLKDKGKGRVYIQRYLNEKGLPSVEIDSEEELQRARAVAAIKFGSWSEKPYTEKQKIAQFLMRRGFEPSVCNSVALNS